MNDYIYKIRPKTIKKYTYSKSHVTFDELEKKANHVFEFGNDWGLYVDIENSEMKYSDFQRSKYKMSTINEYPEYANNIKNIINPKRVDDDDDNNNILNYISLYLYEMKNKFVKNIFSSYFIYIIIGGAFIIRNIYSNNKY